MPILIKAKLEKAESQKNIDKYGLSAHNINMNYYNNKELKTESFGQDILTFQT